MIGRFQWPRPWRLTLSTYTTGPDKVIGLGLKKAWQTHSVEMFRSLFYFVPQGELGGLIWFFSAIYFFSDGSNLRNIYHNITFYTEMKQLFWLFFGNETTMYNQYEVLSGKFKRKSMIVPDPGKVCTRWVFLESGVCSKLRKLGGHPRQICKLRK